MIDVHLVTPESGDWEALYIDGKLYAEGHSLRAIDVFDSISDILGNKVTTITVPDEIAENGMPRYLRDIKV